MKKGSALLIVLGMVAFMVVSAVAFSAYMRYSRLPSSFLRRTSSSRLLAKAALAEAIDQIDIALGNDPYSFTYTFENDNDYPNNGYSSPRMRPSGANENVKDVRRNYWRSHCFIGSNRLVSATETVSTLNLEALAYLPPALINAARFYSRHSTGARWHGFHFDAGRYAFFAVDVSDHLDINRVFANHPRTSADDGKVTLAHVFENDDLPTPFAWDTFMSKYNPAATVMPGEPRKPAGSTFLPLVSLADYNLTVRTLDQKNTMSPFCRYLKGGQFAIDADDDERLKNLAFVTDSYLPKTNVTVTANGPFDLCRVQPFKNMRHEADQQLSYDEQLMDNSTSTELLTHLATKITDLDTVSLYDYLDENDIPTSLALPSVERVPMISALRPSIDLTFQPDVKEEGVDGFDKDKDPTQAEPDGTLKYTVKKYTLKLQSGSVGEIEAYCLYPFHRNHEIDKESSFEVDFAFRIGLLDVASAKPKFLSLRTASSSPFAIKDKAAFEAVNNGIDVSGGIIRGHAKASFSLAEVNNPEQAFQKATATLKFSALETWFNNAVLFAVPYAYEATTDQNTGQRSWQPKGKAKTGRPDLFSINSDLFPLEATGNRSGDFSVEKLISGDPAVPVNLWMTLAARVKSGRSKKYVDLVPAFCGNSESDDQSYNGLSTDPEVMAVCGSQRPIMPVGGSMEITFGETWFENNKRSNIAASIPAASGGGVLVCPDPRWNFAPENFYALDAATVTTLPTPLALISSYELESDGRDCDIFMSVSDQGYMQSPSEIAFLPRSTTAKLPVSGQFGEANKNPNGTNKGTPFVVVNNVSEAAPYGDLAHGNLMWKTYRLFPEDESDNLYNLGITVNGSGFRVNPFTDSKGVMMAALANTPVSWWAASTNYTANAAGKSALKMDIQKFNEKYAFSEMAEDKSLLLGQDELEPIAANMIAEMRQPDGDWEAGFDSLTWDDPTLNRICGVDLPTSTKLYDVDREMLYGFWHDSFANKQQLFLVFVRAEPAQMGGGAIGATPPPLGARAVALVWRDPNPTTKDVGSNQPRPHRTRVLFYRQFD